MQCNAMQCNAMQCNAMQCNAIDYLPLMHLNCAALLNNQINDLCDEQLSQFLHGLGTNSFTENSDGASTAVVGGTLYTTFTNPQVI